MSTFVVPSPTKVPVFTFAIPRPRALSWLFFGRPKKYTMPLLQNLPGELREQLAQTVSGVSQANLDEESAKRIWDTAIEILDQYANGSVSGLNVDQKIALQRAWYEASGLSLGESSASPTS